MLREINRYKLQEPTIFPFISISFPFYINQKEILLKYASRNKVEIDLSNWPYFHLYQPYFYFISTLFLSPINHIGIKNEQPKYRF
jgi:hypothetical protein